MPETDMVKQGSISRVGWELTRFPTESAPWEQHSPRATLKFRQGWTDGVIAIARTHQFGAGEVIVEHIKRSRSLVDDVKATVEDIRRQLMELRAIDDPEIVPTTQAFAKTWLLISATRKCLLEQEETFPSGYVMEDGEGGIRIEWESGDGAKHVRLSIHAEPNEEDYIYYEDEKENLRGADDVSTETLTGWLVWFTA